MRRPLAHTVALAICSVASAKGYAVTPPTGWVEADAATIAELSRYYFADNPASSITLDTAFYPSGTAHVDPTGDSHPIMLVFVKAVDMSRFTRDDLIDYLNADGNFGSSESFGSENRSISHAMNVLAAGRPPQLDAFDEADAMLLSAQRFDAGKRLRHWSNQRDNATAIGISVVSYGESHTVMVQARTPVELQKSLLPVLATSAMSIERSPEEQFDPQFSWDFFGMPFKLWVLIIAVPIAATVGGKLVGMVLGRTIAYAIRGPKTMDDVWPQEHREDLKHGD